MTPNGKKSKLKTSNKIIVSCNKRTKTWRELTRNQAGQVELQKSDGHWTSDINKKEEENQEQATIKPGS